VIVEKDVVLAILGASAALAGFVLVFLGIIIASYQSYSGAVPDPVIEPYRTVGGILLATFGLCLFAVLMSLFWLVGGGLGDVYGLTVGIFVAELIAVFAAAVWATRIVLWR
jgi:uncharacterized membrane protein